MNPRLMLSLWRERWGKADGTTFKVPYVRGKVNQWTHWLPYSEVWSVSGVSAFAMLLCTLLVCLMISIGLSFQSQVVFSMFFVGMALYLRRYAGTLITLVLVAMAVIASTRYLYWRLDTTLSPDFSLNFLFGFYLFAAECYLALLVFAGLIQAIWPLKRASAALPSIQEEWPAVDVFILCDEQPYTAIKLTAMAASKLDWPRKKLKIYLIDGAQRDDLYALAASIGVRYLPHANGPNGHAGFINQSLPSTNGEFIAIFESGQAPSQHFLQSAMGWFLRDQKLAMAQTPNHFLAPSPSQRVLGVVNSPDFAQSCALLRRSAVVQVGGMDEAVVTQKSHMALTLQASGYSSAYIGFDEQKVFSKEEHGQNVITEPSSSTAPELFLVEYPLADHSLLWKQRAALIHRALQFYYPLPRLLFFIAPVAYLLVHVQPVQASSQLLIAYLLPHFLHAHIACARTDEKTRFKLFADIRETVLAWYMLIPTTVTLLITGVRQGLSWLTSTKPDSINKSDKSSKAEPVRLFAPAIFLTYLLAVGLNLAGFFIGLVDMIFSSTSQNELAALYLLWTAYNLMLLAGVLAVAQEARQVVKHTGLRRHLPAMVKLPSGRTISCTTENFPAPVLDLSLPAPVAVEAGAIVSLSIFHGHRELVLPAVVVIRQESKLGVSIVSTAQKDYQLFATAVMSRGADWPKWLPGRDADHPLPKWLTHTFVAVSIAILDFITNINKHLHWARLNSWIQLWKKEK